MDPQATPPPWSKEWFESGGHAAFNAENQPRVAGQPEWTPELPPPAPTWSEPVDETLGRTGRGRGRQWAGVAVMMVAALILLANFAPSSVLPVEPSRWAYSMTGLNSAQSRGLTGAGVVVCLVDSGADLTHSTLRGMKVAAWVDLVNDRSEAYDDNGHGTAMASLLAGQGDWPGAAPGATYIIIKAIRADGEGNDNKVGQAVETCVDKGADVISLSLGGGALSFVSDSSARATRDALLEGVYVVGAAGNDGEDDDGHVSSPGSVPRAISVGAIDSKQVIASFSSVGRGNGPDPNRKPELVAPGVELAAAAPGGGYVLASGTSVAVPLVAGAIALLLEAQPEYQREGAQGGDGEAIDHMKQELTEKARKIGPLAAGEVNHDTYYGYGLLDVEAVLAGLGSNGTA